MYLEFLSDLAREYVSFETLEIALNKLEVTHDAAHTDAVDLSTERD